MKKCPKCGTVLDDSKKKCYMCGADLTASSSVSDFSSSFDNKIGSSVTRGVDNVFNNGKDIDVNSSDMVESNVGNNGSFFSHNSSSRDFFGGEINKLNSMTFDERSESKKKLSSIFGKKKLKSKDEINSKKKKGKTNNQEEGKIKKISYSTNPNVPKEMQESLAEKKNDVKPAGGMFFPGNKPQEKTIKSDLMKKDFNDVPDAFKNFNTFKNKEGKVDFDKEMGPFSKSNNSFFGNDNRNNNPNNGNFNNNINNFGNNNNGNNNNNNRQKDRPNSAFAMFNNNKKDFYNNDNDIKVDVIDNKTNSSDNQTNFKGLVPPKSNPFENIKNKMEFKRLNTIQVKEYGRIAFNFVCVAIFIGILIFVYFRFLKMDSAEKLDSLQYKVPQYFKLNNTDSHYRFYSSKDHGNSCSFEILSGVTKDPNTYVDDYFEYVKKNYESDKKAVPTLQEMKINGNTWKSEKIVYLPDDGSQISAGDIISRFTYIAIVYNGSFYTIKSSNTDEDKECNEQFLNFMNSVAFIESNSK